MTSKVAITFDNAEFDQYLRMVDGHFAASGAHCGDDEDVGFGAIATGAHCGDDDGEA